MWFKLAELEEGRRHGAMAESFLTLARRLVSVLGIWAQEPDELSLERLDYLLTGAERILHICTVLAVSDTAFEEHLPYIQELVRILTEISNQFEIREIGYHPGYYSFNGRGRPRINVTRESLEYFLNSCFSATQIASMLHISLSTIRRRMSLFGLSVSSQYSSLSDSELDRLVCTIQDQYPLCGYRMMIGHLRALGHRLQENRVRNSMIRTDPDGVMSRWITSIRRRSYSVPAPNSLWHIDGNHRLIRYSMSSFYLSTYGCSNMYWVVASDMHTHSASLILCFSLGSRGA